MASAALVGVERLAGRLPCATQHVADPIVGHREVALPTGIAGVSLGQALEDRMRGRW